MEFPVTFSAGDEVQGLFRDLTAAVMYLRLFEMMVRPVKVRAGIGVGEWNVRIKDGMSTQQDGPAYHMARRAIEEARGKQTQRYRVCSESDDELINHLINASFSLKQQQGYMQNIAQMIMELLYPFQKKNLMSYDYEVIKELLNMKYHYKIGYRRFSLASNNLTARGQEAEELEERLLKVIEPIYIDGSSYDSEEAVMKKNMSSRIAEILGCKRQNADMLIKRGNVIVIRNMDYVALQYLEREYVIDDI